MTVCCRRHTSAFIPLGHLRKQHIYTYMSAHTHTSIPSLGYYMWLAAQFLTLNISDFLFLCLWTCENTCGFLLTLVHKDEPTFWVCLQVALVMCHLSVKMYSVQRKQKGIYKKAWTKNSKETPKILFSLGMSRLFLSLGFQTSQKYICDRQAEAS